nr:TPA_exp: putative parasitoid killing factor [Trichoplusia ni]
MKKLICFLLLVCLSHTIIASISYAKVAKTTGLKPCLNTCTDGYCAVNYRLQNDKCTVNEIAGVPVYHTSMYKTNSKWCMSNCNKFGYSYEWCFTDENLEWDYCSSKVRGPSNEFGYDVYGNRCVSNCTVSHITGYFECLLSTGTTSMCAVPAIVPVQSILNVFSNSRQKRGLDKIFAPGSYGTRVLDGRDGHVRDLINNIIYNSGINYETIRNPPAPFTNVVTMNATNTLGETVYLPLIVEATLRQRTPPVPRHSSDIPGAARRNVNNMYSGMTSGIHVGHIIAFQNGGTNDLFNFAGQTAGLNLGQYKTIENFINDWINHDQGTVKMSVVVVYSGTKPTEFAVKLKFFERNGALHSDVLDLIFKNV